MLLIRRTVTLNHYSAVENAKNVSPVNVLNAAIKETPPDDNEAKEFQRLGEKLEGKDC